MPQLLPCIEKLSGLIEAVGALHCGSVTASTALRLIALTASAERTCPVYKKLCMGTNKDGTNAGPVHVSSGAQRSACTLCLQASASMSCC